MEVAAQELQILKHESPVSKVGRQDCVSMWQSVTCAPELWCLVIARKCDAIFNLTCLNLSESYGQKHDLKGH